MMEEGNNEVSKQQKDFGPENIQSEQTEGAFNQSLEKERKPGEQKISVHIFYSPHREGDPVRQMKKLFQDADIYIPEMPGWTDEDLRFYRDLAEGKRQIYNLQEMKIGTSFDTEEMSMINNSHKPITIIDIPEEHPLYREVEDLKKTEDDEFIKDTFLDTLNSIVSRTKAIAGFQKQREKYMQSQLRAKISELTLIYPSLAKKEEIKVLLSLGSIHTSLYRDLKEKEKVKRSFSSMPVFSFINEGQKRELWGKEIDKVLAAKIFLEVQFQGYFHEDIFGLTEYPDDKQKFIRKVISQFTFEEAIELFDSIKKGKSPRSFFEAKLKEKEIKFPTSPAQMDEFLAKPLPRPNAIPNAMQE